MKTRNVALSFLIFNLSFMAMPSMAQRPDDEGVQERQAEMAGKRADKLAKELELEGEAKENFLTTYKAYQQELRNLMKANRAKDKKDEAEKKKISDEEAKKLVQEYFARQEEQIAKLQQRLDIEKKYYAELQKTLTPQQLAKVFRQRQQRPVGQRPSGPHGQFGGFPGGGHPGGFGGQGGF